MSVEWSDEFDSFLTIPGLGHFELCIVIKEPSKLNGLHVPLCFKLIDVFASPRV